MDPALRYSAEFHIPPILDLIAIILFAITGALSAAKRGYDWIGAMSIALVTVSSTRSKVPLPSGLRVAVNH
jgi:Glycine transporter